MKFELRATEARPENIGSLSKVESSTQDRLPDGTPCAPELIYQSGSITEIVSKEVFLTWSERNPSGTSFLPEAA